MARPAATAARARREAAGQDPGPMASVISFQGFPVGSISDADKLRDVIEVLVSRVQGHVVL